MRRLGKGWTPGCPRTSSQTSPNTNAPTGLVTHHSCCRREQPPSQGAQTLSEDEPRLSGSWGTWQAQHTVGSALPSWTREMRETLLPQAGQARRCSMGAEGPLAEWDPHW